MIVMILICDFKTTSIYTKTSRSRMNTFLRLIFFLLGGVLAESSLHYREGKREVMEKSLNKKLERVQKQVKRVVKMLNVLQNSQLDYMEASKVTRKTLRTAIKLKVGARDNGKTSDNSLGKSSVTPTGTDDAAGSDEYDLSDDFLSGDDDDGSSGGGTSGGGTSGGGRVQIQQFQNVSN